MQGQALVPDGTCGSVPGLNGSFPGVMAEGVCAGLPGTLPNAFPSLDAGLLPPMGLPPMCLPPNLVAAGAPVAPPVQVGRPVAPPPGPQPFPQQVLPPQVIPPQVIQPQVIQPQVIPPQVPRQVPPPGLPQQVPPPGLPQQVPPPGAPQLVPPPPGASAATLMNYQHMLQQQAMLASIQTLQAAQAYEQSVSQTLDSEVTELAHNFKLDDRITKDLDQQMKRRGATFEDDMKALWEILEGARNPAGLLRVKIREMEEGSFRGTATPDRDVEDLAKKFGLDAQASAKLAEVLGKRDDRKKDLRQMAKHLELSNRPSSLVMLMLKDLRAGLPVKDPEYPAAVGSYAHKRGLKRDTRRSRSRSRGRRRRQSSSRSRSRERRSRSRGGARSSGAGPLPTTQAPARDDKPRPQTLLERFG